MALFRPTYLDKKSRQQKTSAVWWYEFVFAGKRVRESAKTARKTVAAEAEKRRRLELERVMAGIPTEKPESRIRSVSEALKAYQRAYAVNHDRPKSIEVVKERSVHLNRLLGSLLLPDILEPGRVVDYMERRRQEGASNRTINMELAVLSRAFGQKWSVMWPSVKKLEEANNVGQATEPDQEQAIIDAARKNPSPLLEPFLTTLAWTGMRPDKEARLLRWTQIDFGAGEVRVGQSKTAGGSGRVIPLSQDLRLALERHRARYEGWFGPIRPGWFVFPLSNRRRPVDPERPMTSLKKAWHTIRRQTGVNCRLYDFGRHSFCTKLAEAGVPESVMLDLMGYVSRRMLQRYSHIRSQARRDAIAAVEARFGWGPQSSPQSLGNDPKSDDRKKLKQKVRAVSSAG